MRLYALLFICFLITSCAPSFFVASTDAYGYLDSKKTDSILIPKGTAFSDQTVGNRDGLKFVTLTDTADLLKLAKTGLEPRGMLSNPWVGQLKHRIVYMRKDVLKLLKLKNEGARELKSRIKALPKRKIPIYLNNAGK